MLFIKSLFDKYTININKLNTVVASSGAVAQNVTVKSTGCGNRSPLEEKKYLFLAEELGRKWGTKCLNTRFPLFSLLYAGYSVKQKNVTIVK